MQTQSFSSFLLTLGCLSSGLHGGKWTYTGPHGEHHWSKQYPFCGGTFQSPIDIQTQLLSFDPTLRPIELQNYNLSANEQLTLGNNGHSVLLSLPGKMFISNLPHRYSAAQLHLHWGSSHLPVGSEHTVNGRQFAAEMHVVHFNSDNYPNVSMAADKSDGLAVLGVLIEIGEFNSAFDHILKYINGIKYRDDRVQISAFNIRSLLPVRLDEYYRYDGSLTTPPCYPSVLWTLFKSPISISLQQFQALATAIYSSHQQARPPVPMHSNFRTRQSTDSRVVLCSFQRGGGMHGVTQTVTSHQQRRHLITQFLFGDLADLADQDGINQLLTNKLTAPDKTGYHLKQSRTSQNLNPEDTLCYACLKQKLSRGRTPADTQLVQALRDTLFPELNLRSYLGCKSDLALPTIRQLLRGRADRDEALELDRALVKALTGQRGLATNQQTKTPSKYHPGFGPPPAARPRKPHQTMEWED
ncbi:hypothetical protein UPYG_G00273500 [Umbra pygmaea]|uniref:Carbonic anhydrase n=1 Tax=Umbra pygmaea TaxID=75934 RepID=A0ABD0WXA6_UMBPY